MSNRSYRLVIGCLLTASLYFDFRIGVVVIISLLLFEGITNWRIPILVSRLRFGEASSAQDRSASLFPSKGRKINFDAERAFRLLFAVVMILAYIVFPQSMWVIPWFIAISLIAAGVSGFCPAVIVLIRLGFR